MTKIGNVLYTAQTHTTGGDDVAREIVDAARQTCPFFPIGGGLSAPRFTPSHSPIASETIMKNLHVALAAALATSLVAQGLRFADGQMMLAPALCTLLVEELDEDAGVAQPPAF
jgi:hypothetical protein